jgi:hypothetical protein
MTEKKPSPYAKNFSPLRVEIATFINNHKRTTTEVAAQFEGYSRERMANILRGMVESRILSRETTPEGRVLWFKYVEAPKKAEREMFLNGTMKEPLRMSWMTQPARLGATDANQIRSLGF